MDARRAFIDALGAFLDEVGFDNIIERLRLFFKKFDERKIVITLFIIVVGILSIFYNHDMNRKNDLIRDISFDYDYLYDNYLALNKSYYNLLNNKVMLEDYYNDALTIYENVYDNYNDVLNKNSELINEYKVLQNILNKSTEKCSELQILYTHLSYDYDELVLNLNPSNFSSSYVLADEYNLSLEPEEFLNYSYNIAYPGYLEVEFSSSVDLFVWVGCSGSDPSYFSRFPPYPNTAFDGKFTVPVIRDEVYLYLENPSENAAANISFSVELIH